MIRDRDEEELLITDGAGARGRVVRSSFHLRFPARWRATPPQNRYAAAIEAETLAWLHWHGMGVAADEAEKLRKFACGMYGGCSLPLANYATGLLVTQYISLWLFWDDLQVECELGWSIDDVVSALAGGEPDPVASGAGARDAATSTTRYVAAWCDLGQRLRCTQSDSWLARLGETMRQWLENAKRETALARAYRASGEYPTFAEMLDCRTISIGMYPTFRLIELTEGYELSAAVRSHPSIVALERIASRLVGMGNDLGGLAKDIRDDWLNLVLVLRGRQGLSIERAFEKVVDLHNTEVLSFDEIAAGLPTFGAEDPLVAGYLQSVRHNIYGFALWESLAERYQECRAVVGEHALLAPVTTA